MACFDRNYVIFLLTVYWQYTLSIVLPGLRLETIATHLFDRNSSWFVCSMIRRPLPIFIGNKQTSLDMWCSCLALNIADTQVRCSSHSCNHLQYIIALYYLKYNVYLIMLSLVSSNKKQKKIRLLTISRLTSACLAQYFFSHLVQ